MAVDPKQLRPIPSYRNNISSPQIDEMSFTGLGYTASNSPYLQGTEIVQFYQLLNYTNVKIRVNTSPVVALSGSSQGWLATGESFQSFNDTFSPNNFGTLIARNVDVYNLGRDAKLGPTGKSQYITFVTSGSLGFVPSGSIKSAVSALQTRNRFDTYISHYAEQRDLGQINTYDDGNPFEEPDIIENDPTIILSKVADAIVVPTNLVQVSSSPAAFDGVIEVQDIRRIADRSSVDMPFIIRGPKGSLSISDDNMKSYQFSDVYDLRQTDNPLTAAPYLDYVSVFGSGSNLIDQPGAFSDSEERLKFFVDANETEVLYASGIIDAVIRSLFLSGVLSGTTQYFSPSSNYFPTYQVAARHGFLFSQNDNYGYDSIAFGGLKK